MGSCLKPSPRRLKTPKPLPLPSPFLPPPTPSPRPGLQDPHPPLLPAPQAPDKRTERQGRDEALEAAKGTQVGASAWLGLSMSPCDARGTCPPGTPPRPQKSCRGPQPQSRQRGTPGQEPGTPALGAHGHTLALPRKQLLSLD